MPSDVAEALTAQIDDLIGVTEELRGLDFLEQPEVAVLDKDSLAARIREYLADELDPAELAIETMLWTMFGGLEPGTDLNQLLEDLLAEQVIGFYAGDTGELVVSGDGEELSPLSKSIVVHELTHALVDQHFGSYAERKALLDEDRFDEASALLALSEGDATYVELLYITERLGAGELSSLFAEIGEVETGVFDDSPRFLTEQLIFPYDDGFVFASHLIREGGLAAINAAYEAPPLSTEHIIHPERFDEGEEVDPVGLPTLSLPGYEIYEESTFGELGIRMLFVEQSGLATQLADGWGGDAYIVYSDEDDVVFTLAFQGDSERDTEELANALADLAAVDMGGGDPIVQDGGRTVFETEDLYVEITLSGIGLTWLASTDPVAGALAAETIG